MDQRALSLIEYGLYLVSSGVGTDVGGCIVDVCAQIRNDPPIILVTVQNYDYTQKLIEKSGCFDISVLDKSCPMSLISKFIHSNRPFERKFEDDIYPRDDRGIPYLKESACAVITCDVYIKQDLGAYTQYIGKVRDAWLNNDELPLSYTEYERMELECLSIG